MSMPITISEWISVDYATPASGHYFVKCGHWNECGISVGKWDELDKTWEAESGQDMTKHVTHWAIMYVD